MKIITDSSTLTTQIQAWQGQQQKIAFVPTMGNLHAGHLALVQQAQQIADKVVVSIFVNPTQFDRAEDLQAYPRTEQQDQAKLIAANTDVLFLPDVAVMYPHLAQGQMRAVCSVYVPEIANILEGASREGHFSGVATVVAKLFNLVQPHYALFGEKDFQQLMLIKQMVQDLNFAIEIIAVPTVREKNGLAMSSRNGYLSAAEKQTAAILYQTLQSIQQTIIKAQSQQKNLDYSSLQNQAMQRLSRQGFRPDYIEIRQQCDLYAPKKGQTALVILAAAWLGKARLIDNLAFIS
jgi:pantoate--beta-alanine ligase